jgi:hypothetical protein
MMLREGLHGVYYDMPDTEYRRISALNASGLTAICDHGLWHYYQCYLNPEREFTTSDSLAFGTLLHCAVLEPERFAREYQVVSPGVRARTKAWAKECNGKIGVRASDYHAVQTCIQRINEHNIARGLLFGDKGKSEVTLLWSEQHDNDIIQCKARLDRLLPGWIVDLKSCTDARPDKFAQDCGDYWYDLKAAWYIRAYLQHFPANDCGIVGYALVAIESKWPYTVQVYTYEVDGLVDAFKRMELGVEDYLRGIRQGWHREFDVISVPPPRYKKRKAID